MMEIGECLLTSRATPSGGIFVSLHPSCDGTIGLGRLAPNPSSGNHARATHRRVPNRSGPFGRSLI